MQHHSRGASQEVTAAIDGSLKEWFATGGEVALLDEGRDPTLTSNSQTRGDLTPGQHSFVAAEPCGHASRSSHSAVPHGFYIRAEHLGNRWNDVGHLWSGNVPLPLRMLIAPRFRIDLLLDRRPPLLTSQIDLFDHVAPNVTGARDPIIDETS
jgi:hypothetical protein